MMFLLVCKIAAHYGYDSGGQLVSITAPTGAFWQLDVDGEHSRKPIIYPDGAYDRNGFEGDQLL
jgi:YD repeat-containing protein